MESSPNPGRGCEHDVEFTRLYLLNSSSVQIDKLGQLLLGKSATIPFAPDVGAEIGKQPCLVGWLRHAALGRIKRLTNTAQ